MPKEESTSQRTIAQILATPPALPQAPQTFVATAIVRASRSAATFELALDDTGRSVELPVSAVESAEELAVLNIDGVPTRIVRLTLRRPKVDPAWFDLLVFTLDRLGERLAMSQCSCGCSGHDGGATLPPNALAMAKPKPTKKPAGTWGQCAFCWAVLMGSAEGFCYKYGGCD